jgi:hypothetical protein
MPANVNELSARAILLLRQSPEGLSFGELAARLRSAVPAATTGQVTRTLTTLPDKHACVNRPWRGHYEYIVGLEEPIAIPKGHRENEFYSPFARFVGVIEGCRCVVIGGARMGPLTPDIAGVLGDDVVIAGELKVNHSNYTRGFGQAFGYKVYAHKSWLAVPRNLQPSELSLLSDQCRMGGVGLCVFDIAPEPNFEVIRLAEEGQPDPRRLAEKLPQLRDELGGW